MPQYPFVQFMALSAVVALAGIVVAIPVGLRVGARAGRIVLRSSGLGLLAALAACLLWGRSSGDLARFNARMGADAWLQMGAFFGIILSTGYRFVGRFLDDRVRQSSASEAVASDGSAGAVSAATGSAGAAPAAAATPREEAANDA